MTFSSAFLQQLKSDEQEQKGKSLSR